MGRNELVVVMATNKVNSWLDTAIQSCIDAEGNPDLCLVLDGIELPSNFYWKKHPRIQFVHIPKSQGLAHALAVGVESTNQPFVSRLDADDIASPSRFEEQLDFLKHNPSFGLVGSLAQKIDELGRFGSLLPSPEHSKTIKSELLKRNIFVHSSITFRRSLYQEAGGYDPNLRTMEDYDLWLRMLQQSEGYIVQKVLVHYRIHSEQMSRGAAPWGYHIKKIRKSRKNLASAMKSSKLVCFYETLLWETSQYLRYFKLIKPRNNT